MDKILEILKSIRPDIDFVNEKDLIEGGWLDSFDLAQIISELNDEFKIRIDVKDLMPENFNSAEAIERLVNRLQKK